MPYMRVSMSQKLTPEKSGELYTALGEAFETLPGKSRDYVILDLEDGKKIFFRGARQENYVFAEIHYVGSFAYSLKNKFTEAVYAALERVLGTSKEDACLTITEHTCWGAQGGLHDILYSDEG